MASIYLDTSALVKLYIEEEGSAQVVALMADRDAIQAVILDITLIESRSAIRRRQRQGDISSVDADRVLKQIEEDATGTFLVQPSTSAVMEEAARLLDRHPLRAYDALQLAGCLVVRNDVPGPLTFVCADMRLCEAASLEGVSTLNPLAP